MKLSSTEGMFSCVSQCMKMRTTDFNLDSDSFTQLSIEFIAVGSRLDGCWILDGLFSGKEGCQHERLLLLRPCFLSMKESDSRVSERSMHTT